MSAVILVIDAEDDLLDIWQSVAASTSPAQADALLGQIERACAKLERYPHRGHLPAELERVGISMYREVHCKPYRIIYEICGDEVHVHAILDGRRDMQALLERRMLR